MLCTLILLLAIGAVTWFAYRHNKRKRIYKCLECFKGPPTKPILGNALEFGTNSVEMFKGLNRVQNEYGPICKLFVGPSNVYLIISDPEFLEVLLTSAKHINKGVDYKLMKSWMHNGLLLSSGTYWLNRRKLLTPTFHFKILDEFIPVFNCGSDELVKNLMKEVDKGDFNILPYISAYTLDSFCETAMGTTINAQNSKNNKYVEAIKELCVVYSQRKFSWWKKHDFLFKLSKEYKMESDALDIVHGFTRSVIENRRKEILQRGGKPAVDVDDTGIKRRIAFLDLLLEARIDGEPLSNEAIMEEVSTFMFAGHDTTAAGISFALYALSKNPHIQNKVLEEVNTIYKQMENGQPSMKDLNNMKYLELVIKESLRMYPPVPMITRELLEDFTYKGTTIPKGVNLTGFTYHMFRRPDLFENPEEFNPDRFLQENAEKKHIFSYIPFSAGPRNCIGQKYAMFELKATLSKILRHFELLPPDAKFQPTLLVEVTLKSENGVLLRLKRRRL